MPCILARQNLARAKRPETSLDHIAELINYAHKYWARVYVTVNTLLRDEEIAPAEKLIRDLYEAGADALIIQDTGLLELDLPPLPLFASTQMHNHTPERVAFLEKVGIQRVILARELSLEQIRQSAPEPARAGNLRPRRAVRQLQRAVLPELCPGRAQRQPRTVRAALPPSLPPGRSPTGARAARGPLPALPARPESLRRPGRAAGRGCALVQDRRPA